MSSHKSLYDLSLAPFVVVDPGDGETIPVDRDLLYVPLVSATTETRTLAAPDKAGIEITLAMKTDNGDIVLTVTGTYDGSNSAITFNSVGDWVKLISVNTTGSTYRWRIVQCGGVTGPSASTSGSATVTALLSSGDITLAASDLVFNSTTGQADIVLTTDLNDALSIKDSAADLIVFNTNTLTPRVTITPATTITGALTLTAAPTLNGGIGSFGTTVANINMNVNANNKTDILISNNVNRSLAIKSAAADIVAINTTATPSVTITPATTITGALTLEAAPTFNAGIGSFGTTVANINMNVNANNKTDVLISNNVNRSLAIKSAAADIVAINTTATPSVTITPATTITGALTATAGITLGNNAGIGSSNMVLIGTNNAQYIGFYGITPVARPATIANTDNAVNNLRDTVNACAAALRTLGLIAAS